MKMVQSVLLGIFAFLPSGMASVILCPATSTCLQAADKKVRTSVTGTGKTKSDAETMPQGVLVRSARVTPPLVKKLLGRTKIIFA